MVPPRDGGALVALLAELGYDRGDLSAETFDALFALPSMRVQAFLQWFLASVKPRQSVVRQLANANDYALYTAILDRSLTGQHGLVTGEELIAYESVCQADAQQDESLEELLAQNAGLEHEIAQLETQLQRVNAKNDRINRMVQRKTQQVEKSASGGFQSGFGADKQHFSELLANIQTSSSAYHKASAPSERAAQHISAQIDGVIDSLSVNKSDTPPPPQSLQAFVRHHSELSAAQSRKFLYQQPLIPLQEMELSNLEELKKRVASVVGGSNPDSATQAFALTAGSSTSQNEHSQAVTDADQAQSQPSWLHNANPASLQLHEQDALIYNKCSLELARLEKAYATGEQDALLARMQLAKNGSLWRQMAESKHTHYQQYQLMSPSTVAAKRQALIETMETTRRELGDFVRLTLPKAFEEMAFLRSATILLGSYEQKLWRQEHRFLRLRALLDAFDHQHGRLKLVHRVLDAEWEDLTNVHTMLGALFKDIEGESAQIQVRLNAHPTAINAGSNSRGLLHSRSSIPDADQVAHALYDYLQQSLLSRDQPTDNFHTQDTRGHSFRLRTFEELVRLCDQTYAEAARMTDGLDHVDHEWLQLYKHKRQDLLSLRSELFGDAMPTSAPTLMPPNLIALLQEAVESKENTEQELHAALESLRLKKRELAMDPTRRQQQSDHFERLKQQLATMASEMEQE